MGSTLALLLLGLFALSIGQTIIRRLLNPYGEVPYESLPKSLRTELERIAPDFQQRRVRLTKKCDEARIEGEYFGKRATVEADLDRSRGLVELEFETAHVARERVLADPGELSPAAVGEVERVLGGANASFERSSMKSDIRAGEQHYEIRGRCGEWKWEIEVTANGRLVEVEKERRRGSVG